MLIQTPNISTIKLSNIKNGGLVLGIILQLLLVNVCGFGQSSHFKNYSVEDGLHFIFVSALHQDNQGYLWAGGYGGLSKFDGLNFTHYGAKKNLVNHDVQSVSGDQIGNMWIGTANGLTNLKNDVITNYSTKNGLLSNQINVVRYSENNGVWIGTDKGLNYFDGKVFKEIELSPDRKTKNITALYKDLYGKLWVGTKKGLFVYQKNKNNDLTLAPELSGLSIKSVFVDENNDVWVGCKKGLYKIVVLNGKYKIASFNDSETLSNTEIVSILRDKMGTLWVGTTSGLYAYDNHHFEYYKIARESNSNIIGCLFLDIEDNLWIGTYSGLYRYRGNSFINYSDQDGLNSNFIFPILRDQRGALWIGTNKNGINRYNGKTFESITTENGLSSNGINAALEDKRGNIWIGTDKGLTKAMVDDITGKIVFTNFTTKAGLISDSISAIFQAEDGSLIFGGKGGFTTFKNNRFETYYLPEKAKEFDIWSMIQSNDGKIWMGTYKGGLFSFDGKKITDENEQIGLKSNICLALEKDRKGNIWIGTFEGVFMYDGNKLISINENDGLSSNLIYVMAIDINNEHLWIGTNQGLNKLKLSPFYESGQKTVEHYGKEEGFVGVECNSNGVYKDKDSSIWFGTVNGLSHYVPNDYKENERESITNIIRKKIFYNDTVLPEGVKLPYNMNHLSFDFVGICLTNPKKVRYKYKLEGYDKIWSPATKTQNATYANLPSGKYVLKIISCNNESKWNKKPTTFTFSISTPYWESLWFTILISLLIIGVFSLAFFMQIKNINKKNLLNRRMDHLKLEALRSQMNPHFIFNAMNAIQHYINQNDKKLANEYLSKFAGLMRQVLENSRNSILPIADDLKALKLYIELEHLRFENKFKYQINIDKSIDTDYIEIPANLIQPFVENAINHGLLNKADPGMLTITLTMKKNFLHCKVEDNGIGRKKASIIENEQYKYGHKPAGMSITKDRIQILNEMENSDLRVMITDLEDAAGNAVGTRVNLSIPIESEY